MFNHIIYWDFPEHTKIKFKEKQSSPKDYGIKLLNKRKK